MMGRGKQDGGSWDKRRLNELRRMPSLNTTDERRAMKDDKAARWLRAHEKQNDGRR
jgi:hypothetical protein